jgi:hypothetical protein
MAETKTPDAALPRIFSVRKLKVVLDADLAKLYGVPTGHLNQAVKRNAKKFPPEFSFLLTPKEVEGLMSQTVISNDPPSLVSQIAISKSRRGGTRKLTRAFTEHGALMAATVLRSDRAVQMSLYLIRAFVEMREALLANATILKRLAEIDRRLVEHDSVLRELITQLRPLLDAPAEEETPKTKIGFHQGNR